MQEKNEQITNQLKKEHPWMDVDANLRKIKFLDGNTHLDGKNINPYQETSDDCTGNLFKKK